MEQNPTYSSSRPSASKSEALNIYAEATTLAKQQRIASCYTADAASKVMATYIALRHHAWLRSAGISRYRSRIEDLPFDSTGLFNDKTDEVMNNLHKIRKTAHS